MKGSFIGFWRGYSYNIVKMFINQFAIAIFGLTLAIATGKTENPTLQLICSAFSVLFYLFLIYTMTWEVGASDKIRVDAGRAKATPWRGLIMSLWANIPNFILALLIIVFTPVAVSHQWAGNTVAVAKFIALFIEGMYTGLITVEVAGNPLNYYSWTYLLITLPALLTSALSYWAGMHNFRVMSLFGLNYDNSKPTSGRPNMSGREKK
ncbi:MAG: hypothetical protein IJF49_00470 [Clostridia bacterium]|nr:hypothetical protein [Clostridia bacterium]